MLASGLKIMEPIIGLPNFELIVGVPQQEAVLVGERNHEKFPEYITIGLIYIALALVLRGPLFGSPVIHIDEQFYLLVGDRMLHGSLPYVDIWDRKPIGLFLLYAGIRELGGSGFVQYQVVAMLVVSATSLVICGLASEIAPRKGAIWSGVVYQLYLSAFNCFGGQAPVFYNLLVASAALIICKIWIDKQSKNIIPGGVVAMVLIGIALQIKYSVIFEGVAFGLVLIARVWLDGWHWARIIFVAVFWAGIALIPTALAFTTYVEMGHGHAFFYANFLSIFGRSEPMADALARLGKEAVCLTPFAIAILIAPRVLTVQQISNQRARMFLTFWSVVALAGFLIFGTWYDHYVAPLLLPLSVIAAPALGRAAHDGRFQSGTIGGLGFAGDSRGFTTLLVGFGVIAAGYMTIYETIHHGTRREVEHVAELIQSRMAGGCAYLNEGDPSLYFLTNSCLVTSWIFPNHLAGADEAYGIGIDPAKEVSRIMASRPAVVMIATKPSSKPPNLQTRAIVLAELSHDYVRYAVAKVGKREFQLFSLVNTTKNKF